MTGKVLESLMINEQSTDYYPLAQTSVLDRRHCAKFPERMNKKNSSNDHGRSKVKFLEEVATSYCFADLFSRSNELLLVLEEAMVSRARRVDPGPGPEIFLLPGPGPKISDMMNFS